MWAHEQREYAQQPREVRLVTRRKGRVLGAVVGTVLLGPLGLFLGAMFGTRSETRERARSMWE